MNTELTVTTSKLLINKLGVVATRLQQAADPTGANPDFTTLESVVVEANKILSDFYQRLSDPQYNPVVIAAETIPFADDYNSNFQGIADDLEILFAEFENFETVVLGNFNYMVSRLNRLNGKLTSVNSLLGDFILFSDLPTKDAYYFQDSFNNLDRVEFQSSLLTDTQCEIDMDEGIVLLPIDTTSETTLNITVPPVINSNSNGTPGNSSEVGAAYNGDMSMMFDGNSDTWFEYERISVPSITSTGQAVLDDGVALVLDFTVNLGTPTVINHIRINPNNFGTPTQIEIVAIDTSLEGETFTSIKNDIPIADFLYETEEKVFTLAPSTSKFAGQGFYTFSPRKAKFIRFSLRQSTAYSIVTDAGPPQKTSLRYAIGIRDVEVKGQPYAKTGQVISAELTSTDEISKVGILSSQNPDPATQSLLASIDHYISPDNGISWYQLRPMVSAGVSEAIQTIPESLNFNGVEATTITTQNPVMSLRYRANLTRNPDAFVSDAAELAEVIENFTEMHQAPITSPFQITLQHRPIDGTVSVADPLMGSRGKEATRYYLAKGTGSKLRLKTPFAPLVQNISKVQQDFPASGTWFNVSEDPQTIYVDGVAWTRGDFSSPNTYKFNFQDGWLEFGDGTVGGGTLVPQGSVVSMTLSEERIFPTGAGNHVAQFQYPTALDQNRVEITVRGLSTSASTLLNKGSTRHQLNPNIDSTIPMQFNNSPINTPPTDVMGSGMFQTPVLFIDGNTEFVGSSGCYSVDFTNGMLYSSRATNLSTDIHAIYKYFPEESLANSDWSFQDLSGSKAAINISNTKFQGFTASTFTLPMGRKYYCLPNLGVVQGTLKLTMADGTTRKEVPFIDGKTELSSYAKTTENLALFPLPLADNYALKHHPPLVIPVLEEITVNQYYGIIGSYPTKYKLWIPTVIAMDEYWKWYASWRTKLVIVNDPNYPVSFSNHDIFKNGPVQDLFSENYEGKVGDWSIVVPTGNKPTSEIWLLASDQKITADIILRDLLGAGTVTYYYDTYAARGTYNDKYSVNYNTGEIFFAVEVGAPVSSSIETVVNYQYTNYYAKYDILRKVEPLNWTYDADKNVINISDGEILYSMEVPQTSPETVAQKYYRVSYQYVKKARQDIAELEPYFTPVLKSYAIKVITKSRLT